MALKDLDFLDADQKIEIGQRNKEKLMKIIQSDAKFFSSCEIIDYSMLIGIHERSRPELQNSGDCSQSLVSAS